MYKNLNFKSKKDIESASETIIPAINSSSPANNSIPKKPISITSQMADSENFDNFLEKRK